MKTTNQVIKEYGHEKFVRSIIRTVGKDNLEDHLNLTMTWKDVSGMHWHGSQQKKLQDGFVTKHFLSV